MTQNFTNPFSSTTANAGATNPYMMSQANYAGTSYPSSTYGGANQAQLNNLLASLNQQAQPANPVQQPQQAPQPAFDPSAYVTKEDYERLLNEKRALQEKLESELAQRVDIEFFRMEQEMMTLPEGARLAQELEYQKNRFFDALWRTSEPGKGAIIKYRDSIQGLYDRYRSESAQMLQAQQQALANQKPINTAPQRNEEETF